MITHYGDVAAQQELSEETGSLRALTVDQPALSHGRLAYNLSWGAD